MQRFMPVQRCKIGISEFWPKLTYLLQQQINFVVEALKLFLLMVFYYFARFVYFRVLSKELLDYVVILYRIL